ncbi:B-cell receptor CD22-like [Oncorhynchus masou masou]|uniref:B-cell receptor CD22-like n=1 Tax=Oncorhynchus masou masou TaxID=90313 RepID=UPI003182F019
MVGNAKMALRTTGSVIVVFILSVSGGLGQFIVTYNKTSIFALKGSSVDLPCSYTYPSGYTVTTTQWHNWKYRQYNNEMMHRSEYSGRVEYRGNKINDCTLRIRNLRESDSGEYRFRYETITQHTWSYIWRPTSGGVTLSVTDLKVWLTSTIVTEGSPVALTCRSISPLSDILAYVWYKNKKYLQYNSSIWYIYSVSSEDAGSYSCAVKGHEDFHSPEVTLTVIYKRKNISVSVSLSGEIVEGSSVTLTCSSDANPPVQKYTWYKRNITTPKAPGQIYNISYISLEDSGEYYCEAGNKYGLINSSSVFVNVQYRPKNTSVSVSPSGEIVERSSVNLTCNSDANPAVQKYTWFKKTVISPKAFGQIYSITNINSEDSGEYYCEAQNEKGASNSTVRLIIVSTKKQTSSINIAVGITVVALVLILLFSFLWFRKRAPKSTDTRDTAEDGQGGSSHLYDTISGMAMTSPAVQTVDTDEDGQGGSSHLYDTISGMAMTPPAVQTVDTDEEDNIHYDSVHFSPFRNQEVPMYSTVQLPNKEIQYTVVKFKHLVVAPQPATHGAEDQSAIYSTVNKPRTWAQEGTFICSHTVFPRPLTGSL